MGIAHADAKYRVPTGEVLEHGVCDYPIRGNIIGSHGLTVCVARRLPVERMPHTCLNPASGSIILRIYYEVCLRWNLYQVHVEGAGESTGSRAVSRHANPWLLMI